MILQRFKNPNPEPAFKVELQMYELQGCCGVRVFARMDRYAAATLKAHKQDFIDYLSVHTTGIKQGLALVSLNHIQTVYWDKVLKAAGFQMSHKAENQNTHNSVFLYTKVIHPTNRTELGG